MIGKHFLIGLSSTKLTKEEKELLTKWQPFGVMLFRKNFEFNSNWFESLKNLIIEIKEINPNIVIATDYEGGRVHHFPPPVTNFPFARKFQEYSAQVAKEQAFILKSLGFNLSFAPVVDINSNPNNPVIGPRAFGDNSEDVIKYASIYMKELHVQGIKSCLKHFPGHGNTTQDSHLELPSLESLDKNDLAPFKELINLGADGVMTAHVLIKSINNKYPATLADEILNNLLRKELNFSGLIFSDCVTGMRAIFDNYPISTVISNFFNSTGDVILMWDREGVNHEEYFIELEKQSLKDQKLADKLNESELRINKYLNTVESYIPTQIADSIFNNNKILISKIEEKVNSIFLQEAEYQSTKIPDSEPNIRVGIVLEEDKISYQEITFPDDGEILSIDGHKIQVKKSEIVVIKSIPKGIIINDLEINSKITLKTFNKINFAPQSGFKVKSVIAGRIFHWRKEITQTFTGFLEIYSQDNHLVIVNELPFEDYLAAVATSEMSAECPIDTLKAQAITARSYALAYQHGKHPGEPFSVCNDDDCQRYQGTTHSYPHIYQAILETRGEIICKDNQVVRAHYSKCCGGFTDLPEDTWEVKVLGLDSVIYDGENSKIKNLDLSKDEDFNKMLNLESEYKNIFCHAGLSSKELKKYLGNVDDEADYFKWNYTLSIQQLAENLKNKFKLENVNKILKIEFLANHQGVIRTKSGRYTKLKITYLDFNNNEQFFIIPREYNIRKALHQSFLFSTAFIFEEIYEDNTLTKINFTGIGWGHGAGYCQVGGLGMAIKGYNYKEIIQHYFPNCELKKCY